MSSTNLTSGAIASYRNGNIQQPAIVKVLNIKQCNTTSAASNDTERYRLSISDGQDTFDACMLAPELNKLIKENRLCENSIIKLEKVVHNLTSTGKPFLSLLDLTIQPATTGPSTTPKPTANGSSTTSKPTTNGSSTTPKQANTSICPIDMITPYINGMWKMRARCFAKSSVRPPLPVCNFDFVDASGEIRVVAFRDECTRFHPMIEVDKVYDLLGVRVKNADKRFNNLRNMYELTLTPASIVRLVDDETTNQSIPDIHYEFVPLQDVSKHSHESFIDVIGIVDTCSAVIPFTNRTSNRESKRREVTIIDEDTSMSITLWDEQAENFDEELVENKAVVAFQRTRVAIYNNKYSLSGHRNMNMKVNPDILKAKHLRIWYDAGGRLNNNQTTTVRPALEVQWKTIGQIEKEKLGRQSRADYVMVKATCMHIADDRMLYTGCPNEDCYRKVNKLSSGLYRCDRCEKDFGECRWVYMLRAELADSTGAIWVSFFRQQAQELMGNVTAEEFARAKENGDENLMQTYLNNSSFREKVFRLKVHEETFNDITMVKVTCVSISDVDFSEYGRRLINIIENEF